jgi:hypothetical protein
MKRVFVLVFGLMAILFISGCTTGPGGEPKGVGDPCTLALECAEMDCNQDLPVCENGKCPCPWREVPLADEIISNLSTPENTFDLYMESIRNENLAFMRELHVKKQQQDLVDEKMLLIQTMIDEGDEPLWKLLFFQEPGLEEFDPVIIPGRSGRPNTFVEGGWINISNYMSYYSIDYNVGLGVYSVSFALEDGEWRIPADWSTYVLEETA